MIKKILLGLLGLVLVAAITLFTIVQLNWNKTYDIEYPQLKSSTDSAVIARGEYLVRGPAHCGSCHVSSYEEIIKAEKGEILPLKGGVKFPLGPLGFIFPLNLTPDEKTGIGRYEDGEIFRMMRHAVKPDGTSSIPPMMPFWNMADEDVIAVVSYLRSMEPVYNEVDGPDYSFIGKAVRTFASITDPILNPTPPSEAPPMEPTIERGEYLARYVANCVGCHTPRDPMTFQPIGPEFSGGFEMEPFPELNKLLGVDPDLWSRSVNITPYEGSALSKFKTVDDWIARFRSGKIIPNSPMQWGSFGKMSDEDLEALWLFLNSLEPVENDLGPTVFKK